MIERRQITYDDASVRRFLWASLFWAGVGMLAGLFLACQLAYWPLNTPWAYFHFGRFRPVHTNLVIYAFVGNMIFAGVYYSTQRLCKARMASDWLSRLHFWGWQAGVAAMAVTYPLGITAGKEYAEAEWPIKIAVAVVWVAFAVNFFWTLARRNEKHLYVALWFYIASILTIAVLWIVNGLAIPVGLWKSYSVYGGVQDALVQWWFGHNAVAFFLTTPVLGIMYYFLPKAAGKPVYSYRLSIVHFWALVFMYIWAGPHHLLNTSLPDWAQDLGTVFSLALWAPSWGGMINGLLTLRGAWDRLRTDPVIKFFAAALTCYGMVTFEGPLMSIRGVNALAHDTDWVIGHVHDGTLGWNGFMAAGMFYWLVPRLYGVKLRSERAANVHFWTGLVGLVLYVSAMYVSGVTQGLMWRATTPQGTLMYPNFLETLLAQRNMYWLRAAGGGLYLVGFAIMAWNLVATARSGAPAEVTVDVEVDRPEGPKVPWTRLVFGPVVGLLVLGFLLVMALGVKNTPVGVAALAALAILALAVWLLQRRGFGRVDGRDWHELLEGRALLFTVLALLAVLIGGMVQILPTVLGGSAADTRRPTPYTALELAGRDIYVREGCYLCHTQMVRELGWEALRYGKPSESWESAYDHPFQWGSKRIGPDLARVGGKYPDLWHYRHLMDPRSTSEGSIMPGFAFLAGRTVDRSRLPKVMRVMRTLGVPYTDAQIASGPQDALAQGERIASGLKAAGAEKAAPDSELVALIAYLQKLGTDNK